MTAYNIQLDILVYQISVHSAYIDKTPINSWSVNFFTKAFLYTQFQAILSVHNQESMCRCNEHTIQIFRFSMQQYDRLDE